MSVISFIFNPFAIDYIYYLIQKIEPPPQQYAVVCHTDIFPV